MRDGPSVRLAPRHSGLVASGEAHPRRRPDGRGAAGCGRRPAPQRRPPVSVRGLARIGRGKPIVLGSTGADIRPRLSVSGHT
ncbi:conserved hypothetical protein [Frankia alni ACN14a]|uniref:Uncharacterized protein n=1 Tax=Frankia alni (strain DSM 45986 / CECT 9034 / ACN14a) TaxID=326424 RepID=Q0RQN0_FRAAA|nr:conserved hypothetical protein [Frankia alni ACN14a]